MHHLSYIIICYVFLEHLTFSQSFHINLKKKKLFKSYIPSEHFMDEF